jgi:hypothetical protein
VKSSLLALLFLVFGCSVGVAQYGSKATWRFLNVPTSPFSAALGGVPVSLTTGSPAQMHANPAFLTPESSRNLSVSYTRYLSDANMGFLSSAYDIEKIGTLGVGLRFINYGQLDRIDEFGIDRGSFNASDVAFKVALARNFEDWIRFGLAADFIYSSYDSYQASGVAFSGGVLYDDPEANYSVGLSFINLGTQLSTFDGTREELPFDLRLGVTRKLQYLPLRITFTAHQLHKWDLRTVNDESDPGFFANLARHMALGGDFLFSESFRVRVGYNHLTHEELKTGQRLELVGFGFGVAIKYKGIDVEFSRNSYSVMGSLFQLGINTRL